MSIEATVTSAWLPPRHRSITTPLIALKTWKLLYQAYVHGYIHECYTDRMLVSISFEAIGKSSQVNQVGISSFEDVCISIELNDHGSAFIQSAKPSGRHKIMAQDVKHLPRFKLYRPIIVGALEVRLAVDLAVLLSNHNWCTRHLSWRLCCGS